MKNIFSRIGIDWFLPALAAVILIARVFPDAGTRSAPFSLDTLSGYGITVIFFFYGLRQDPQRFIQGLENWKLHALIQAATFVLFPVLAFLLLPFFSEGMHDPIWKGIYFLCVLPSTVSTSVVMVSVAGGNIPAAIFNASLSGILGVFITPLWMSILLQSSNGGPELSVILSKLTIQILLPVAMGILLHSRLGSFAEKNKKRLRVFDQLVILSIVYISFARSFSNNAFSSVELKDLLCLSAGMALLFALVFGLLNFTGTFTGFDNADRKTLVFCGSKKSLVHGTVMSAVFFSQTSGAGVVLLPLMLYHALQIVFASILAQRMSRNG